MAEDTIHVLHHNEMAYTAHIDGYTFEMDANPEVGGENFGPRPKPVLLASLAACTGMDVASLLKKMRTEYASLSIQATGELTEEHPKMYHKIHLTYVFNGKNLDQNPSKANIEKAVKLSQEKYCGVSALLRKGAELTYEIKFGV